MGGLDAIARPGVGITNPAFSIMLTVHFPHRVGAAIIAKWKT